MSPIAKVGDGFLVAVFNIKALSQGEVFPWATFYLKIILVFGPAPVPPHLPPPVYPLLHDGPNFKVCTRSCT